MMKSMLFGLCLLATSFGGALFADAISPNLPRVVILMGPPGSGKGTQAVQLSKELGIPHLSTGDILRENIRSGTSLGKEAKTFMDAGKLVPDDLIYKMFYDRTAQPDASKGYLLDGMPRTLHQAETLEKYFTGKAKVTVINLDVPDDVIVKRISGRRVCKKNGHICNIYASSKSAESCEVCEGELYQRDDDRPEVVSERLKVYHAQTEPVIEYFRKKGVLITVDGTQAPETVFKNLLGPLNKN